MLKGTSNEYGLQSVYNGNGYLGVITPPTRCLFGNIRYK